MADDTAVAGDAAFAVVKDGLPAWVTQARADPAPRPSGRWSWWRNGRA